MSGRTPKKRRSQKAPAPPRSAEFPWIAADLRPLAEPLEAILPDPKNARTHDENNLRAIVASLRQFGQRKPIVVNRRGGVIEAGSGTYEAAKRIGWTHLAVVWVEDDPAAARGYSIADNRTAELAEWDQLSLETLLSEIADDSPEIYQELLLAELSEKIKSDGNGNSGANQPVDDQFSLVVECRDEADQQALYKRLTEEGRKCRPLTL